MQLECSILTNIFKLTDFFIIVLYALKIQKKCPFLWTTKNHKQISPFSLNHQQMRKTIDKPRQCLFCDSDTWPNSKQINQPISSHTYPKWTPNHIHHHYAPFVTP